MDPRVATLVAEARLQHRLFGGQTIDPQGHLVQAGFYEAETDRPPGESTPTWRRVLGFWQSLDPGKPREVRGENGRFTPVAPLLEALQAQEDSGALDEPQRAALANSVLRMALVDNPWSAAFISYLEKTAGLDEQEFAFSDAHHVYVEQAFRTAAAEPSAAGAVAGAYRACDIATTTPRAGDLICHTRGASAGLDGFESLRSALAARRLPPLPGLPMHCDLVVAVDREHGLLESIGGNVLQSVTLRQMALDPAPVSAVSQRYFTRLPEDDAASCTGGSACAPAGNFNRQPWAVLLQWRN